MKTAVITFHGSNCDRDAIIALQKFNSKVENIWYKESSLNNDYDLIIIPGGFSYGDYLRSGAMASISSVMSEVKRLADRGVKIIGICNGFQILTESKLLDGVLMRNKYGKFICKNVYLKVENSNSNLLSKYQVNQIISLPIAHMDGNFFAEEKTLISIEQESRVAFRYCQIDGDVNEKSNPNGSINNIAGIFNRQKNILGMMPHPERAIDKKTGNEIGLKIFESIL